MKTPRQTFAVRFLPLLALTALVVVGCATFEELAPPITDRSIALAEDQGIPIEHIEHGRSVYLVQCSRCHSPEAVERYSHDEWMHDILPRMILRAELEGDDARDLEAYVQLTLGALGEAHLPRPNGALQQSPG